MLEIKGINVSRRDEGMKASEVFNKSKPLLGKTSSFAEAFPSIAELYVKVEEHGKHVNKRSPQTIYTHTTPPGECVNCSNPLCYDGGVRIAEVIRKMDYSQETELRETYDCKGSEGSRQGKICYGPCYQSFDVYIKITYKT